MNAVFYVGSFVGAREQSKIRMIQSGGNNKLSGHLGSTFFIYNLNKLQYQFYLLANRFGGNMCDWISRLTMTSLVSWICDWTSFGDIREWVSTTNLFRPNLFVWDNTKKDVPSGIGIIWVGSSFNSDMRRGRAETTLLGSISSSWSLRRWKNKL